MPLGLANMMKVILILNMNNIINKSDYDEVQI